MCGRLVLTSNYKEKIKAIFDAVSDDEWLPPRYNIAPGQRLPVICEDSPGRLQWLKWGFLPPPRTDKPGPRSLLINARAETIDRLPTFQHAFGNRRCIILADGFYEWKRAKKRKPQPYFFSLKTHAVFALAGLMLGGSDSEASGCVVVTTEANSLMHSVHDRMPVMFHPETARTWLNPDTSREVLSTILQPYPSGEMATHPVSERVNRSSSEGPDLIEPVRIIEQTELF